MKGNKKLIMLSSTVIIIVLLSYLYVTKDTLTLNTHVLINRLSSDLPSHITFHLTDMRDSALHSFTLDDTYTLQATNPYVAFTEGFVAEDTLSHYHHLIEEYHDSEGTFLPRFLYQIYEDSDFIALSYVDLETSVYVFDKQTDALVPITFPYSIYFHTLSIVDDTVIGIGNMANALEEVTFRYSLTEDTFIDYDLSPTAHSISSYERVVLNNLSIIMLEDNNTVLIQLDNQTTTPLYTLQSSSMLLVDEGQVVAVTPFDSSFTVTLLDEYLSLSDTLLFDRPTPSSELVDVIFKDGYLYTLFYDRSYSRFMYYFNIYELDSGKLQFSLGFESLEPYIISSIQYH